MSHAEKNLVYQNDKVYQKDKWVSNYMNKLENDLDSCDLEDMKRDRAEVRNFMREVVLGNVDRHELKFLQRFEQTLSDSIEVSSVF